jgi:hypothetical protein
MLFVLLFYRLLFGLFDNDDFLFGLLFRGEAVLDYNVLLSVLFELFALLHHCYYYY